MVSNQIQKYNINKQNKEQHSSNRNQKEEDNNNYKIATS